jgi:hypothetical protein
MGGLAVSHHAVQSLSMLFRQKQYVVAEDQAQLAPALRLVQQALPQQLPVAQISRRRREVQPPDRAKKVRTVFFRKRWWDAPLADPEILREFSEALTALLFPYCLVDIPQDQLSSA